MALAEILEAIRAEAETTASDIIARAENEADRVLENARAEATSEERRFAGSLDDRISTERARVVSRSHLEAARARRRAREDAYRRAIDAVARRIADERAIDSYPMLLGSLLDEAMMAMPGATSLRVDPGDVDVMQKVLASKNLDVEVETEDLPLGGLVLAGPGWTVDNTLAARIARADSHLRFIAGEIIPEMRGGGSE